MISSAHSYYHTCIYFAREFIAGWFISSCFYSKTVILHNATRLLLQYERMGNHLLTCVSWLTYEEFGMKSGMLKWNGHWGKWCSEIKKIKHFGNENFKWLAVNSYREKNQEEVTLTDNEMNFKRLLNYFAILWSHGHICIYCMSCVLNIYIWTYVCYCCRNRSAWRRRRSCPKTWARQPPSSSSFSKPLRSSWPKRETRWEHYRSTWKARWDSCDLKATYTLLYAQTV